MSDETLWNVLLDAAREAPEQVTVHVRGDGTELAVTYRQLQAGAVRVAGGLLAAGMAPGTCVPLVADRSEDFQVMFWGLIGAGLVPVPLAADARRVVPVWEHLGRPPLFVDAAGAEVVRDLPGEATVLRVDGLPDGDALDVAVPCAPGGLAFVQFSSGSTGQPKGVELTHAAVTANLRQIVAVSDLGEADVMVSWMPYFHDMGLIGTHLAPLAARAKQVKIGPLAFARRPGVWFETATAHRATHLSAANFALALAVRRIPDADMARFDLRSVRRVVVGAEPISASVWRDFIRRTRLTGLAAHALQPVYGLAEATLAVTFPPPGEVAVPLVVERGALGRGRVVDALGADGDAVELMDLGHPVPGCSVRIVGDGGEVLGERLVGHIEVRGPQLARGYRGLPDDTAAAFTTEGWLRTGDLGFLRAGRLCVSGRHKDVLFLNGLKYHACDLEEVAAGTPGLPPGPAAVVGSTDPATGRERVVVCVAWARPPRSADEVLRRVADRVGEALFHDDVRVVALPPGQFPRTTSGKIRRHVLRDRFEAGRYVRVVTRALGDAAAAPAGLGSGGDGVPRSRAAAERAVREVWAGVLGRPVERIGAHTSFRALGGTSLKAMEVLAALEDVFGRRLEVSSLRAGADSVAGIVDHLLDGTRAQLESESTESGKGAGRSDGSGPQADGTLTVVGLACRFPGADSPEEYWRLLAEGRDLVTPVLPHRWDGEEIPEARWGAFLKDPAGFDAARFGIGDAEARALDPQARLLLELAHEALERAGYAGPRRRAHRIGVFTTAGDSGYRELLERAARADGTELPPAALTGNLPNLLAARIAHSFDLDGPALAVDTACSSALVALHLARRSLADGECDIALVGGVNLHLTPTAHRMLHAAQALSPTGRSRAFGAGADGFVPGEGGAVLVLRRTADARRAGDDLLAVVRGTAVNNDGTSLSLMAPNPARQREVITAAHAAAAVDPAEVTYIEAHGTGTALGDPVELASLASAFPPLPGGRPRLLGSAKTNIGHLLNAAALPGLVKVVLALRHGQVPPSLHADPPATPVAGSGFQVPGRLVPWPAPPSGGPLVAGINAFGFGGTNAHAVLERAPVPAGRTTRAERQAGGPHLLALSAATAPALRALVRELSGHLAAHPEITEADLCLTVGTARDADRHRLALVCDGDVRAQLAALAAAGDTADHPPAAAPNEVTGHTPAASDVSSDTVRARPRLVFLFPGQGTQRPGMAAGLHATAPMFRETLDEASAHLGPLFGRTLTDWCTDPGVDPAELARTEITQPVLVAFAVALTRQLSAWGVVPDAVTGHSVGELAAACAAGLLPLSDTVRFAAERGRLIAELTERGAMAAVRGAQDAVDALVDASDGALAVAVRNAPGRLVLSGTERAVDDAVAELTGRGVAARRLQVTRAFHSPLMEPAARALYDAARAMSPGTARVPLLSTLTGDWAPAPDASHWREHALRPVEFGAAARRLVEDGFDTFVEIGPATDLPGAVRLAAADFSGPAPVTLSALPATRWEDGRGRDALLRTVARLWTRGTAVDHAALAPTGRRVPLPTYPFQRRPYWPGPDAARLLHRVTWTPAPLPDLLGPVPVTLVAGPEGEAVRELSARLAERGVPVAEAGAESAHIVVHLSGRAADSAGPAAAAAFRDTLRQFDRAGAKRLLLLTEDAHRTGAEGEAVPCPGQALLTALALAFPEETEGATLVCADLSSEDTAEQRLASVVSELSASGDEVSVAAWRGGERLRRGVEPLPRDAAADLADPLPADGVYLITGGAGGLGAALARDLAGRGRPTLLLTGRSPRPPAALLAELGELGADARYQRADVTDERQLDALLAEAPAPDVVFHLAGVAVPGSLRGTGREDTSRSLAAKTLGTRLLARALHRHGHRPALCVAFSSVTSVLPGAAGALGDYAAANAYLDAFAAAERAAGRRWLALNLGAVARTGLAATAAEHTPLRAGGTPLAPAEALRALRAACAVDTAQLVLADLGVTAAPVLLAPDPAPAPAPAAASDGTSDTRTLVRALLAEALHLPAEAVDEDAAFLSLGLDSLSAVDLVRRLEHALGRELATTLFFEYRTVRELAEHLDTATSTEAGNTGPEEAVAESPVAEGTPFALTPVQLALHTSSVLYPRTPARGWVRQTVRGPLDPGLLRRSLTALAERHGMLRVRIGPDDARGLTPHQTVTAGDDVTVWFETRPCPEGQEALEALETELANRPLDLTAEPPLRALLLTGDAGVAHLVLSVHHVAADGYSLNVLCTELWTLYTDLALGRVPAPLPPAADFAAHATGGRPTVRAEDTAYWTARLANRSPMPLPYDGRPDPDEGPGPLVAEHCMLDEDLVAVLRERAARWNVSLFHLLLAAYVRCLARWSGQRDIVVNVARAGRDARLPGLDRLVGPLADTLPLLLEADPDEPLHRLAERVRLSWLDSERHATVSSLDLARLLPSDVPGPRTTSPASFSFARFPAPLDPDCPVGVRPTAAGTGSAATRLNLLCWEDGTALRLSWNFPERLFTPATVARLATAFERELRSPDTGPSPEGAGGSRSTVAGRLRDGFRKAPDAVAVDDGRVALTYRELDAATGALARRLRENGVRRGDLVGMLTTPGPGTVIAVAGILRAGAGWVPLDAEHPTARLAEQTGRCGVRVVVHDDRTRATARELTALTAVPVTRPDDGTGTGPAEDGPGETADADATAYVIFTSGSTGRPKAVPITFRSMENYLDWAEEAFAYGPGDRLANTSSPCFDASVRQLLAPLLTGSTVVTADRDLVRDPELLLHHMARTRITVWSSVPSLWERLLTAAENLVRRGEPLPDLSALRLVQVGGEVLWADWVRRWYDLFGPGQTIVNLYGPTETTINATFHAVTERPGDEIAALPIGRAVTGTELLVVGSDGASPGPGGTGELLIGGVGLSAGYLGEPQLTRAAFTERDGRRWYRSGDRVEVLADGVLRFVGRLDEQVKIRGHRVEPGEVEAVLRARADVAQAVVLAGEGRLSAFVVLRDAEAGAGVDAVALRRHLAASLPPYMVPARITLLDALPLTGTGKVDRRALPAARAEALTADVPPSTTGDTEERLGRVWCELLGVDRVAPDDDFFELGGDSLLALQVFDRLARHGGGPLPRPTVVYRHRTLAALAAALDRAAQEEPDATGQPASDDGPAGPGGPARPADPAVPAAFPVTPSQRGFLLSEALAPGTGVTWLARLRLAGPLDRELFQRAVDILVARHPMLRTVFPAGARPPVQQELPASLRLPVGFAAVSGPEELAEQVENERRRRFEPWAWPLLRLRVLTLAPHEHVLVVHAHHLIGDGYSAALLLGELTAVHDALSNGAAPALPELRGTFREFAQRFEERAAPPRAEDEGARARRAALSAPYAKPALRVADREGTVPSSPEFHSHGFVLDATATGALRKIAADAGATLYAPLLAAYHGALAARTGQEDLIIGVAVSGRDHPLPDIHRVFGPFATAVAVRPFGPGAEATSGNFTRRVRRVVEETVAARVHEDVVPRDAGGLPLTSQFFFTFLDFGALGPQGGDVLAVRWDEEEDSDFRPPSAGTDVFLAVRPDGDLLRVTVRGAAAAFDTAALAAFADGLRDRLVRTVPATGRRPLVPRPVRHIPRSAGQDLDAALVGYLPAPAQLARLARLPDTPSAREDIRRLLFPGGEPRLLETTSTPLGRSGFVALPLFADELADDRALAGHTARAVRTAAALGARCVSLAGMIPSLTGYGFDVLRADRAAEGSVTTGHAATVVSVVRTVRAALPATGRDLADLEVAVIGLGSIGASSLELLLTLAERPPARLVLCDVPGSGPRLRELARTLRERGLATEVAVSASDPDLPDAVYGAGLVVAAVSGSRTLIDVERLRPGTVVVDDSFPHCFDTGRALARMRERGDVLVVGGGLLTVGDTRRTLADGLADAAAEAAASYGIAGTLASCRAESLLYASGANVPLVRGLVDAPTALAYWRAVEGAGVTAGPLHLLGHVLEPPAVIPPGLVTPDTEGAT
ncbi:MULTISPECIES: amino acid adenylation domain-containing protein [unclassified Streptomyces]|uniref:amino acid adenylation domain-containing protein n=1 Tax=unclassified Streptomyces TaxID=2593676 RepID=UPI003813DC70